MFSRFVKITLFSSNSQVRIWLRRLFRLAACRLVPIALVVGLSACATEPAPTVPNMEELATQDLYQLNITNFTDEVVNTILFRPCGKAGDDFAILAENLKPGERVAFNLFNTCIDIKAMNTFDQTLAEKDGLALSKISHWDIQWNQPQGNASTNTVSASAKKTQ